METTAVEPLLHTPPVVVLVRVVEEPTQTLIVPANEATTGTVNTFVVAVTTVTHAFALVRL